MASLDGGTDTPSYGLGLACCAMRNGELRAKLKAGVAAAAKEKSDFFIVCPLKRSNTALTD
jgi:hypothetical protein